MCLVKHSCPSTTIQDLYATLCHSGEMPYTSTDLIPLYYTKRRLSHSLMYTLDHTLGFRSKKFRRACAESSMHAHRTKSEVEILKIVKLLWDAIGLGQWDTDLQVCKRMPGSDPRAGKFHQTRITMGDTTCSVKGV